LYLFKDIEELLGAHYSGLKGDQLFIDKDEITVWRKNPLHYGGSITTTRGITVEAQALIMHMFCRFDTNLFGPIPKYFFVYHVRIYVD
jgi:hypothetical protein